MIRHDRCRGRRRGIPIDHIHCSRAIDRAAIAQLTILVLTPALDRTTLDDGTSVTVARCYGSSTANTQNVNWRPRVDQIAIAELPVEVAAPAFDAARDQRAGEVDATRHRGSAANADYFCSRRGVNARGWSGPVTELSLRVIAPASDCSTCHNGASMRMARRNRSRTTHINDISRPNVVKPPIAELADTVVAPASNSAIGN